MYDNIESNNEKINLKLTESKVFADKLNQEIIDLQEYNTEFSNKTSINFLKTEEYTQSIIEQQNS